MDAAATIAKLRKDLQSLEDSLHAAEQPQLDPANVADALGAYLALSPAMAEDELLQSLLACAQDVVQAQSASVAMYDPDKNKLVFSAAVGATAAKIIGLAVSLENTQMGIAFRTGQPIAAAPLDHSVDKVVGEENRSVLVAPLLVDGVAIGTLSAVNKKTAADFTPADIMAFMRFADVAAHIIAQRDREASLRQCLLGACPRVPTALKHTDVEEVVRQGVDSRVFAMARTLSQVARQDPEALDVIEKTITLVAEGLY